MRIEQDVDGIERNVFQKQLGTSFSSSFIDANHDRCFVLLKKWVWIIKNHCLSLSITFPQTNTLKSQVNPELILGGTLRAFLPLFPAADFSSFLHRADRMMLCVQSLNALKIQQMDSPSTCLPNTDIKK